MSRPTPPDLVLTNFAWLLRLRWGAILSQLATLGVVQGLLHLELDLDRLLSIVGLTALSNFVCARLLLGKVALSEWMLTALMGLDFALLTAMLYLAGGASNPFSVLYLVHVALAASVLKASHAWVLAVMSSAAFGSLFLLPFRHDAVVHAMGMHDHAATGMVGLHFQGMWLAFSIAAFVIVYFVSRVNRDLDAQRSAAAEARTQALRSEKLASLATLAAGAAHELATPLSTIAVVAKELSRDLAHVENSKDALADAELIREEVERCRRILTQLSSDAGESMGEGFTVLTSAELIELCLESLREPRRVWAEGAGDDRVRLPARSVASALRAVIDNALDASDENTQVSVQVVTTPEALEIRVIDRGAGMDAGTLARIGEPFFTTKPTGRGMGLGLFLARTLVERLGGSFSVESVVAQGTRVTLRLPREPSPTMEAMQ